MTQPAKLTLEQQRKRGEDALRLLTSPVMEDAFKAVKERYLKMFLGSKPEETDLREQLYLSANALEDVRSQLRAHVRDGGIANTKLASAVKIDKKAKEMLG